MPMDFPDMNSLKQRASGRGFRQPEPSETEEHYRKALADYVRQIDPVESIEIATGKGWDKHEPAVILGHLLGGQ